MPNSKIILTKTNRPNATPHPNDLDYGELAINYEDGLLFFKNNSGRISKIASSGSFSQLTRHLADRENPHEITKAQVGLDRVDNSNDLEKPISTSTQAALDVKVNLSTLNSEYYNKTETVGQITTKFGEIGIQVQEPSEVNPAGNLSYDRDSNTFIYTEATIPTLASLGALGSNSIRIDPSSPEIGSGTLIYQGGGVFTYDRPTIGGLDGYAKSEIGLAYKTSGDSDGTLTYSDGFFTYDQPTIAGLTDGKITLINDVLDVEGFARNEELSSLIDKEAQDVLNLKEKIDSNDIDIENLQSEVVDNNVDITALQNKDIELEGSIESNNVDITALQNKDIELEGSIESNEAAIRAAEITISNFDAAVTSVTTTLSGNNSDISGLDTRITTNDDNIIDLQDQIEANNVDITALQDTDTSLQDQIDSNNVDITALQDTDVNLDTRLADATAVAADANAAAISNGVEIATLKIKDGNLQDQIDNINFDSEIEALQDTDITLQDGIENLAKQIGNNETDIGALERTLVTANSQITTNESDISTLSSSVAKKANKSEIPAVPSFKLSGTVLTITDPNS